MTAVYLREHSATSSGGAKSEEKGGGREDEDASETGYRGGGDCSDSTSGTGALMLLLCFLPFLICSWRKRPSDSSGDTDGPDPGSCDVDNLADVWRSGRLVRRDRVGVGGGGGGGDGDESDMDKPASMHRKTKGRAESFDSKGYSTGISGRNVGRGE